MQLRSRRVEVEKEYSRIVILEVSPQICALWREKLDRMRQHFSEYWNSLFWPVDQSQGIPGEMGHFLYHILENKLYRSEAVLHRGTGKGVS